MYTDISDVEELVDDNEVQAEDETMINVTEGEENDLVTIIKHLTNDQSLDNDMKVMLTS